MVQMNPDAQVCLLSPLLLLLLLLLLLMIMMMMMTTKNAPHFERAQGCAYTEGIEKTNTLMDNSETNVYIHPRTTQ